MASRTATRDGTGAATGARPRRAAPGADGLLDKALQLFYRYGYAGTSVRQIASESGVTVAALYHHFESKHDMLVALMQGAMEQSLREVTQAAESAVESPPERLRAIVTAMVRYHTKHQVEAFVGNSELRSLEKPARRQIVELRDQQESLVRATIEAGVADGSFTVQQPARAARAVIAMCVAVASWYRPKGELSIPDLCDLYSGYALDMVGYRPKATRRRG